MIWSIGATTVDTGATIATRMAFALTVRFKTFTRQEWMSMTLAATGRAKKWTVNDMRLGDLDALKVYVKHTDLTAKEKVALLFAIAEAPTIDAVPVVRCKDCKHSDEDDFDGSLWCCRDKEIEVPEEHFCSYGERKDGEG